VVRPGGLRGPDGPEVVGGEGLDGARGVVRPGEVDRADAVKRLVGGAQAGQGGEGQDLAADAVDAEEGGARPARLEGDQRGAGVGVGLPGQDGGELAQGGGLQEGGQRQRRAEGLLDGDEDLGGGEGIPAQLEEVVVGADSFTPQDPSPDLRQPFLWPAKGWVSHSTSVSSVGRRGRARGGAFRAGGGGRPGFPFRRETPPGERGFGPCTKDDSRFGGGPEGKKPAPAGPAQSPFQSLRMRSTCSTSSSLTPSRRR
jgi:hypothetical protein